MSVSLSVYELLYSDLRVFKLSVYFLISVFTFIYVSSLFLSLPMFHLGRYLHVNLSLKESLFVFFILILVFVFLSFAAPPLITECV